VRESHPLPFSPTVAGRHLGRTNVGTTRSQFQTGAAIIAAGIRSTPMHCAAPNTLALVTHIRIPRVSMRVCQFHDRDSRRCSGSPTYLKLIRASPCLARSCQPSEPAIAQDSRSCGMSNQCLSAKQENKLGWIVLMLIRHRLCLSEIPISLR
jgi:hypothetical protein